MTAQLTDIAIIAFTEHGCALARRISNALDSDARSCEASGPARFAGDGIEAYESLGAWTTGQFAVRDALVFVGAAGIAVRAIAPHAHDKLCDPAVVSVDEAGRFAIPLLSGHVGAANDLAREIACIIGGQAVISTATDVNEVFAVDEWAARRGLAIVERELAKEISARLLEGGTVGSAVPDELARELPDHVKDNSSDLGFTVSADEEAKPFPRTLHLVMRTTTLGVGCRKGTDPALLRTAADEALARAGLSHHTVKAIASIDVKRDEPAIAELARAYRCKTRFFTAEELRAVPGTFEESEFVEKTVGVGNVCERAALADGGRLALRKQSGNGVTIAIATSDALSPKRQNDNFSNTPTTGPGRVSVVGLGPGGACDMTRRAFDALSASDLIVGYTVYIDLLRDEFAGKEMLATPMRKETERCELALQRASKGAKVALVCSGDPGVYGMAGLVLGLAHDYPDVHVDVIAGVSAANGGAAVLGAPLMHDWCTISLSDLLTPWDTIERRLRTAAEGDFVIVLYNPASHKRRGYLARACDVLLETGKSPDTACGIVRNIGRDGQQHATCTLAELRDAPVDMFTTVFIGNSQTRMLDASMVTPRGYDRELK